MAFLETLSFCQTLLVVTLLVVPVLYLTVKPFKYYFKLVVYFAMVLIIGLGTIIYGIPRPRNPKNHFFVSFWVKKFLSPLLGVEVIIRGQENLDTDQPVIIVLNHQSSLDMLPLFAMWPDNCVILAKKELIWSSGTFGLGAWMCGTIYINRVNRQSAIKTLDGTSSLVKSKKLKVIFFPEGTRNHNGSMLPFKKGAFHLAVEAQVPVVPVVVSSYNNFYNKKEKRFDEGKVIVEILPPIPTTGLTAEDVTPFSEKTRDLMLEHFERINSEVKTL
ncbi:unnamed protein product [Candidula unifasciata]|uniref:1-acyl-sn-glycerol-3-phosphate acyltransferase n=1 Tax=Candidula unifasciata TaxID=100452 RepID=A0A8S3ZCF0_9EUPU|nr:unnamed protein product [Candidula unifasciata]